MIAKGTQAIKDEVEKRGTPTDKSCLEYILTSKAGACRDKFPNPPHFMDCDSNGKLLDSRKVKSGARKGQGMVLQDFVDAAKNRYAALEEWHVVAIRLYTTAAFMSINQPIREKSQSKVLIVTAYYIAEAINLMRDKSATPSAANEQEVRAIFLPSPLHHS